MRAHKLVGTSTDKLSAARDGQAHAEKVAQRLEKQLLAQAQTALQQQQASRRGPAPAIKSGKQHTGEHGCLVPCKRVLAPARANRALTLF